MRHLRIAMNVPSPQPTAQAPAQPAPRSNGRGVDFTVPGTGGGGAIDPVTGLVALGLVIVAIRVSRQGRGNT
jgi:hypothetical protein